MKITFLVASIFIQISLFAQNNDQKLIDIVSKQSQIFIWRKPIPINTSYFNVYQDSTVFYRRTRILNFLPASYQIEFYHKLKYQNDSKWENQEFQSKIFIEIRETNISLNVIREEIGFQLTKEIKKKIRQYNRLDINLRPISYLSRPIYSDDLEYAIIQIVTPIGNLGGGGKILLFKYTNFEWIFEGNLAEWVY